MTTWNAVFPEVEDPEDLDALLRRIDAVELPRAPRWRPDQALSCTVAERFATEGPSFGVVTAHLVADLVEPVSDALRDLTLLAEPSRVSARIQEHLVVHANTLVVRTLLRRLDRARRAGTLDGAGPEERFAAYVAQVSTPAGLAALADDAVDLLDWVRLVVRLRRDAILAMLRDTQAQWESLSGTVAGVRSGDRVEDVELGSGDTHGRGQSVVILALDSGSRVVVKPRDLRVEQGFTRFSSWLGAQAGIEVPWPTSYTTELRGWVEYLDGRAAPADGHLRVAGAQLAALYLLDATDIHYENVLTNRNGMPVVIDAETLMTPRVDSPGVGHRPDGLLGVAATGMLSLRREQADDSLLDAGALAYRPGGRSPFRGWKAVNVGRDDMRLEMSAVQVDHPGPAPAARRRSRADRDELVGGFTDVVSWVLRHRERTQHAIEEFFDGGDVRYVHRPTMLYHQVLRMATHPAFASHEARRRVLGRLAVLDPPTPLPLVAAEMRQLAVGDMPSFHVPLRGTTVRDGHGADTGVRCRRSPLAGCLLAVGQLTDEDADNEAAAVQHGLAAWGADEAGQARRAQASERNEDAP